MNRFLCLLFCLIPLSLSAQIGLGFRFGANINSFPKAEQFGLVPNAFTTGQFGVFYSQYYLSHGFEAGLNVVHKGGNFNLPVVMRDFGDDAQNVQYTAIETDLKVGPRLGAFNPKIGYVVGYRLRQSGFQVPGQEGPLNPWYLMLPFGCSVNLPTQYGSVGFGGYYHIGIFNVKSNPGTVTGAIYEGGRHRYLNVEIVVTFGTQMPRERE